MKHMVKRFFFKLQQVLSALLVVVFFLFYFFKAAKLMQLTMPNCFMPNCFTAFRSENFSFNASD